MGDEGSEPNHPTGLRMSSRVLIIVGIAVAFLIKDYFILESITNVASQQTSSLTVAPSTTIATYNNGYEP